MVIAWRWIGVGSVYPAFLMFFMRYFLHRYCVRSCSNETSGAGTSRPETWIWYFFLDNPTTWNTQFKSTPTVNKRLGVKITVKPNIYALQLLNIFGIPLVCISSQSLRFRLNRFKNYHMYQIEHVHNKELGS